MSGLSTSTEINSVDDESDSNYEEANSRPRARKQRESYD